MAELMSKLRAAHEIMGKLPGAGICKSADGGERVTIVVENADGTFTELQVTGVSDRVHTLPGF